MDKKNISMDYILTSSLSEKNPQLSYYLDTYHISNYGRLKRFLDDQAITIDETTYIQLMHAYVDACGLKGISLHDISTELFEKDVSIKVLMDVFELDNLEQVKENLDKIPGAMTRRRLKRSINDIEDQISFINKTDEDYTKKRVKSSKKY